MSTTHLVHVSDLHFGRDVDLDQVEALLGYVAQAKPDAVVVSGDLTQRARHGEFQRALVFCRELTRVAPTLVIPGNHDVQWWASLFGVRGSRPRYAKYRCYFGAELAPSLSVNGVLLAGVLTSHGIAAGSLTWNLNDLAVKGHLPRAEVRRVAQLFEARPAGALSCVVMHHNLVAGAISERQGLARWRAAQRALVRAGVELVLAGHDHQEAAVELDGGMVTATASTHTRRTRGHRPSVFNHLAVDATSIGVRQVRWDRDRRAFQPSDLAQFARRRA